MTYHYQGLLQAFCDFSFRKLLKPFSYDSDPTRSLEITVIIYFVQVSVKMLNTGEDFYGKVHKK